MENTELLTGDTSADAEQDNVTQQKTASTRSANGSKTRAASKVGLNQLSFKRAQFSRQQRMPRMFMSYVRNAQNMPVNTSLYL